MGTQVTVSVHALSAGSITLPERFFVSPSDSEASKTVPSLCFLIQHISRTASPRIPSTITRIVFDLGIRRDISRYDSGIQSHIKTRQPYTTEPDVVASLAEGGLSPDNIDFVILSHIHWDHVGLPTDFKRSRFVVGGGTQDLVSGKTVLSNGRHSNFANLLLPTDRTIELPDPDRGAPPSSTLPIGKILNTTAEKSFYHGQWHPKFLFPSVIDIFQDGSVYIVSAPGHVPGHLNLLCRVATEPARYVYLAGDACHDERLLTGEKSIAEWTDQDEPSAVRCIHADKTAAAATIEKIRHVSQGRCKALGGVEVVFAHHARWEKKAVEEGRFWPGKL